MLFDDTYKTISRSSEGAFRDRGSKFVAFAFPIRSEAEFREMLNKIKSEHPKANHHCWALRLTTDRSVFRISDDGEPSGTAGRPILNTLLSMDLTDLVIIVVRYFGGIQLGIPGLINAYKTACLDAINNTSIIEKDIRDQYRLEFDFLSLNDVMKIIKESNLVSEGQNFNIECSIDVSIPKSQLNQVIEKFEKIEGLKTTFLKRE